MNNDLSNAILELAPEGLAPPLAATRRPWVARGKAAPRGRKKASV